MRFHRLMVSCVLILAGVSHASAQEQDPAPAPAFTTEAPMPEGFARLRLRATTRKGIPTSPYMVRFEKDNLGNMAVSVDLNIPEGSSERAGRLGYQYFRPNGQLYRDKRSREGFSQVTKSLRLNSKQKINQLLLEGDYLFFALGYHRLELWWQDVGQEGWHPAGTVIFEVIWD